jgi:hypothetical protein
VFRVVFTAVNLPAVLGTELRRVFGVGPFLRSARLPFETQRVWATESRIGTCPAGVVTTKSKTSHLYAIERGRTIPGHLALTTQLGCAVCRSRPHGTDRRMQRRPPVGRGRFVCRIGSCRHIADLDAEHPWRFRLRELVNESRTARSNRRPRTRWVECLRRKRACGWLALPPEARIEVRQLSGDEAGAGFRF